MKNKQNIIWLGITFVLIFLIGVVYALSAPKKENSIVTTIPNETAVPAIRHSLEKLNINTKYNDGAKCEFYVDPTTEIVYMVFDSYDVSGITPVFHPETGRPLLLDEFYEIYAEYIPKKT